ncbi:MAG: HAMP domain-containing histidine kinase [Oscillospiraceae bacterium]|jgi:signal transduction histidine kinase|nr:HAMP domain-containing histidine kinase [Oscillospiraceae bacterium]
MLRPERAAEKRNCLAAQSRTWLTGFSVCILLILWVLQFALFTPSYYTLRLREIRQAGREIAEVYERRGDFGSLLRQYAITQNLRILLLDSSGWVLSNYDGFGTPFVVDGGHVDISGLVSRLKTEREISYIAAGTAGNASRAVYVAKATPSPSGDRYIYVASAIPPADVTVRVLATQFVFITVVLLFLASVGAYMLSRRIAKPILRLTDSAKDLAKGEFKARVLPEDYTEIVELNEELTRATQALTKTERYRRELLANVSHDLKTPLTIIKFYGEMIRDFSAEGQTEKIVAHSAKIIEESDRLAEMVNGLLEVSKLEQTQEIASEPLRLDLLLEETLGRFSALEAQEFVFDYTAPGEVTVMGNRELLGRVVYNLIANAVSYVGEDKRVEVRLVLQKQPGGATIARVEVTDHGQGIPSEELPHIWERYYKSSQSHRRGVAGSGLGLSIVRTALRLHKADFGAESVLEQGSTFWFVLPVVAGGGA